MRRKDSTEKDDLRRRVMDLKRRHPGPYLEPFMRAYPNHDNWRDTVKLMNVMSMRSLDEEFIVMMEMLYDTTPQTENSK
jgi:hypothetical protein